MKEWNEGEGTYEFAKGHKVQDDPSFKRTLALDAFDEELELLNAGIETA